MRRTVFAVLIVLIVATGAQAQTMATSTVTGKVTAEGAPLPGVRVTATSERLQGPRSTVTDANGAYLRPFLPPGAYTVTFEMAQMQTHEEILRARLEALEIPLLELDPVGFDEVLDHPPVDGVDEQQAALAALS